MKILIHKLLKVKTFLLSMSMVFLGLASIGILGYLFRSYFSYTEQYDSAQIQLRELKHQVAETELKYRNEKEKRVALSQESDQKIASKSEAIAGIEKSLIQKEHESTNLVAQIKAIGEKRKKANVLLLLRQFIIESHRHKKHVCL